MRKWSQLLFVALILILVSGCSGDIRARTSWQTESGQPENSVDEMNDCPPPDGYGTVPPAISIASITFEVNGIEVLVRDGEGLQVQTGDEVRIDEVALCVGSFSGNGGEACVDVVPVSTDGQEIVTEHQGSHLFFLSPGRVTITGLGFVWTKEDGWASFSAVLNHWAPESTADPDCASGGCERDDWMIVAFQ